MVGLALDQPGNIHRSHRGDLGIAPGSLAVKLGLSPETVEALLELAGSESEEVLTAVDDAVCAVIATINAVYGDLLAIAGNSGG